MNEIWPSLPFDEWKDTYATLHMWSQIVGKIRLVKTPLMNHWWNSALYVTPRGLTTSAIPTDTRVFGIDFDFIDHKLLIGVSDGTTKSIPLAPRSVADFYADLMSVLKSIGIDVTIQARPDEVPNPIPFAEDHVHATYVPEQANRFWRILVQTDKIFNRFRSKFIGKCSPVHFFWGSFDLAVTRFSGRRAPDRPGADAITREGYSHECISHGWWPGGGAIQGPAFYSYTAPAPEGFEFQRVKPDSATYSKDTSGFLLMYDDVRTARPPEHDILEFMQSTYEAGANLAGWNRAELERS